MELLKIYDGVEEGFGEFLENPNNERVLFSAKFGMGKTTFLKYFFDKNKAKYNAFYLFPVNYSVQENKDIFSLIKYDILYYLLIEYKYLFSNSEIKPEVFLPKYLHKYAYKLLLPLLMFQDPSIGIKIYSVLNKEIETFIEKYEKENQSENDVVDNLGLSLLNEEGNIYERNYLTELIIAGLQEVKKLEVDTGDNKNSEMSSETEEETFKENVLVIDDLDRLDPKHIFRLLNVFAAHFDYSEEQKRTYGNNKFGFDKIVFVTDANNIQRVYEHFYGLKADFNGYIDKFFSTQIYYFDTNDNIEQLVENIISQNKIYYVYSNDYNRSEHPISFQNSTIYKKCIIFLLILLLKCNSITMRSLVKVNMRYYKIPFAIHNFKPENINIYGGELLGWILIETLIVFLGSKNRLIEVLSVLKDNLSDDSKTISLEIYNPFLVILLQNQHKYHYQYIGEIDMSDYIKGAENDKTGYELIKNPAGNYSLKLSGRILVSSSMLINMILESIKKLEEMKFL